MKYVNVLLDIAGRGQAPIYTYGLDEALEGKATPGRRVIVNLGARFVEGWIIEALPEAPAGIRAKPVVRVSDEEPLFSHKLWDLTKWVADTYVCPLNIALKAMLPPRPSRYTPEYVVPIRRLDPLNGVGDFSEQVLNFLHTLNHRGSMNWSAALREVNREELNMLIKQGWISALGTAPKKDFSEGWQYRLVPFEMTDELPLLSKKAPRQAEVIEFLTVQEKCDAVQLEKKFGRRVIQALINKGFLIKERISGEVVAPGFSLTAEQKSVLDQVEKSLDAGKNDQYLLFGITGSGKTEIYLRLAQKVIQRGKKVLVLVPEIALTRHLTEVFSQRIPGVAVLHSHMSAGERYRKFREIANGKIDLVLGTRLAVFAPLSDLGLIIIDEEQENTFKQEESPRYHAREVARQRALLEGAVLLLGSATPSLESFCRVGEGSMQLLRLRERAGIAELPRVHIEDLRKSSVQMGSGIISPGLRECLNEALTLGHQSILFINRRGHSPHTQCRACGKALQCPNCSVALSFHRHNDKLQCHYCGFQASQPAACPDCGSRALAQQGVGTEKVEEEVKRLFPDARVARLDLDSSSRGRQQEVLAGMQSGNIDILVGTQMVAKGLDYPSVSLVGIVDADGLLNLPDFRAGERAFQLMVQAAGRAGRGSVRGQVVIQTYNPDHYIVQRAVKQDYESFFKEESSWREMLNYPPYTHLLRVVASAGDEAAARCLAVSLSRIIDEVLDAKEEEVQILGPAACPLARLHKRYRYQILVKSPNILLLSSIGRYIMNRERTAEGKVEVDVDPLVTM